MKKKTTIFVLKRSNGMCGIYIDGKDHLVSNAPLSDASTYLLQRLLHQLKKYPDAKVVITDKEEDFVSGLPSLESYIANS